MDRFLQKSIVYIESNGEKYKAFLLNLGTIQRFPLSQYLFNIIFKGLSREVRQLKEIGGIKWNGRS